MTDKWGCMFEGNQSFEKIKIAMQRRSSMKISSNIITKIWSLAWAALKS